MIKKVGRFTLTGYYFSLMNSTVHFHFKWFEISAVYFHSIYYHSKLFETVQSIFILFIFHSKCILNKHLFYLFHPFGMIKTILNGQNHFNQILILPISSIWSFFSFGMTKNGFDNSKLGWPKWPELTFPNSALLLLRKSLYLKVYNINICVYSI